MRGFQTYIVAGFCDLDDLSVRQVSCLSRYGVSAIVPTCGLACVEALDLEADGIALEPAFKMGRVANVAGHIQAVNGTGHRPQR